MGLENARSFQMHLPGLLRLPLETPPLCRLALVRPDFFRLLRHRLHLGPHLLAPRPARLRHPPKALSNPNLTAPLRLKDRLTRQMPPPQLWRVFRLMVIEHQQLCGRKIVWEKLC